MSYNVSGKKLAHHPGCQCRVQISEDGVIDFISYTTLVIRAVPQKLAPQYFDERTDLVQKSGEYIDDEAYFLECTGTYSQTTRKQIGYFLKEYFGSITYQDIKEIAGENTVIIAHRGHAQYW